MTNKEIYNKTENMLERACDMFPHKHKPSKYMSGGETPFPMHGFERNAVICWSSFMYKRGMTDSGVEGLLRPKKMCQMFDELSGSPTIDMLTDSLLTDSMVESAKREAGAYYND